MVCTIELSLTNLVILAFLYFLGKKSLQFYKDWKTQELLERWNNTPKDKVIHGIARAVELPSISPYVLKLETYLRMANISYELECKDSFGPKGKTPWISINGTHVTDSTLIIQFLNKKFEKNLNAHLSPEDKEIARAVRMMLENHFLWGVASWRWVENLNEIESIMKWPKLMVIYKRFMSKKKAAGLAAHGLGLHNFTQRTNLTSADLRTVSTILGNKAFISGEACEEDSAIFAILAQVVFGAPGSPYLKLIEDELPNLKQYCYRMKEKYWPDWLECLDKKTDYY